MKRDRNLLNVGIFTVAMLLVAAIALTAWWGARRRLSSLLYIESSFATHCATQPLAMR